MFAGVEISLSVCVKYAISIRPKNIGKPLPLVE